MPVINQLAMIAPRIVATIRHNASAAPSFSKLPPRQLFFTDTLMVPPAAQTPTPLSSQLAYERTIAELEHSLAKDEQDNRLQECSKGFLLAHPNLPSRGTLVLFHGWSAGTWQFEEIASKFFEAGYTVYAPRLPGHGYAKEDQVHDNSHIPKAGEVNRYEEFVERIYNRIEGLPGPKSILGFSGGGALAMRTIERYNTFEKAVLIAPFLRPKVKPARWLNRIFTAADPYTQGYLGKALDAIPYTMGRSGTSAGLKEGISGHGQVSVGNIHALSKFGEGVINGASDADTPIQFIMSRSDATSDDDAMTELYGRLNPTRTHRWFEFPLEEGVPHTMVHPKEKGCPREKTDKVFETALGFLTEDQGSP